MAEHKSQHYVPQFYLRNFTSDEQDFIGLHIINCGKTVRDAPIKPQACEDYFYGKDLEIEKRFGDFEGEASSAIAEIIDTNHAPIRYSDKYHLLIFYTLIQLARTKASSEFSRDIFSAVIAAVTAGAESLEVGEKGAAINSPVLLSLQAGILAIPSATDLMCKVLVNQTQVSFITSDHPVVLHNQYARPLGISGMAGLANNGVQIFFPISPRHLIVFYDDRVYKIGEKHKSFAMVASESDVSKFNELQWLNANRIIFFDRSQLPENIVRRKLAVVDKRRSGGLSTSEEQKNNAKQGKATLTVFSKNDVNANLSVECIKQRRQLADEELRKGYCGRRKLA